MRNPPFLCKMSSKSSFQEFQSSENRKKVDMQVRENLNSQHMEDAADTILLRKSLAWDSAFFTSPGVLDPEELFETLNFRAVDSGVDVTGGRGWESFKSEFAEAERTIGFGSCNMRKSLAWDSEFFTSAGVLDAEELFIVNRGFRKSGTYILPEIHEELCSPDESSSQLNCYDYSLSNLELNLFDDIRASLHNSRKESSNAVTSACKSGGEKRVRNGHVLKIPATSSRARLEDLNGESSPFWSLKPPKISGSANHPSVVPKNRASLGANQVKAESKATNKAAKGKSTSMPKKTCLRDSSVTFRSSTPSAKSTSSVLPTATKQSATFSSAPYFSGKSPQNSLMRNDCRVSASVSTFRTPEKCSAGNKSGLANYRDSTCSLSTPDSSSCASPSSSISNWSSKSSLASAEHRSSQLNSGLESRETRSVSSLVKKTSSRSSDIPANVSKNFRPSGLRMPSPKIGFFESANSMGLSLNGDLKFHSGTQISSSKIGTGTGSDRVAANKSRRVKQQLLRTSIGTVNRAGAEGNSKFCLREKKQQTPKGHEHIKERIPENVACGFREENKENVGNLENQVDALSIGMQNIHFGRGFGHKP